MLSTEQKVLWIKAVLAFRGTISVHRVSRIKSQAFQLPGGYGRQKTYAVVPGHIAVNRKGQLVHRTGSSGCLGYYAVCSSVFKAFERSRDVSGSSPLQTRGILPDHVIDILFDRLRQPAE